jgi:hypothetical protein
MGQGNAIEIVIGIVEPHPQFAYAVVHVIINVSARKILK